MTMEPDDFLHGAQSFSAGCHGARHTWPSLSGDPVTPEVFHGQRCYCGQKRLHVSKCGECGADKISYVEHMTGPA